MRQKLITTSLALCACSSLFLTTNGFADDKELKGEYKADRKYQTTLRDSHNLTCSSKIIGASVQDQQGQNLGKIEDLILFPGNGRIEFGLLKLDVTDHQGHLTAVPWQLFRMKEGNVYTLNTERDKLLSAKMWDNTSSIDFSDPSFGKNMYTHYGLNWDDRMSVGGRVSVPSGVETGVDRNYQGTDDDDLKFKRPQPDGRSTFPQLNPEEKEPR